LNDPYDIQFDLHIEVDHEAVKRVALRKLWEGFYGDQVPSSGNLFGALITQFRDVFPRVSREEFDHEFGEAIDEAFKRGEAALPTLQAEVRVHMADSKILCLSEVPDSTVMWTHYAEGHQGLVLRVKSIPELDSAWGAARPVQYMADMPRLLDNEFLADLLSGRVSMNVETIMDRLVYTKSTDWVYEREWRIFAGSGRNARASYEDIPFSAQELDAVILGNRMPEEERSMFIEIIRSRYPHAQILEMRKAQKRFQWEIISIEP
jgi:hypothetical protein